MKKGIRTLAMVLLLTVLLSGCDYEAIGNSVKNELANMLTDPADMVEPFVGFASKEVEDMDLLRQVEPQELEAYVSQYGSYNTYTYFEALNDSEKLVYKAYEYALDQALPCIWIDDRLLPDLQRSSFDILQFLALDSAVVGQNLHQRQGGYTISHSILNVETAYEAYTSIYVENFEADKLRRQDEAIAKARDILSQMPQNLTDRQKVEYFYDWLGKNLVYETDIEGEDYLYTALCQGKTNCDGYTNTMALLCSLSDIPCVEKNSDTPEGEEGHTWNAVFIEGKWVNVDATAARHDIESDCENRRQERVYFGFGDSLLTEQVLWADLVPSCPQGLSSVLHISSGEIEDFTRQIQSAFEENDDKFAVILVDEGDLEKQINEDLATDLGFDLHFMHYETAEGKTAYYLFNDEPAD